ncbi:MAG: hypothetical protein FWE88_03020 [Phycisphaerae bacterium]|nr:hypothetical protein [Phycisphaerae bacterium]
MISVITDLTSMGAAGVMGAMWLWERRASAQRERELTESHGRILRDEQRLDKLTHVVEQATAAITRFQQTQQEMSELIKHVLKEIHHGGTTETRNQKPETRNKPQ